MTFHDDKRWQEAYTALLDLLELDGTSIVVAKSQKMGMKTLALIADALTRRDRRQGEEKLRDAGGKIAGIRSLLSVAWAQEILDDDTFGKLDASYEALANKLPR